VSATAVINHGRQDIYSAGGPSDASITLVGFDRFPVAIGDTINVQAYGVDRFTGTVTYLELTHARAPGADFPLTGEYPTLRLDAIGALAAIGGIRVLDAGRVKENLQLRVDAILAATGKTYTANCDPGYEMEALAASDGGYQAQDLLQRLCADTGATICDTPDGAILFESYSVRGYGYNPAHWADLVPTDTFGGFLYIWADVYDRTEAAPATIVLPHDAVVWAPTWRNDLAGVVNDITVSYGTNSTTTQTDTASISTYGQRAVKLDTDLHKLADAQRRAGDIIRAQAAPRWALGNITVLVHKLPSLTKTQLLAAISGGRVTINDLPEPHPIEDYTGIIEGWTEQYGPDWHTITLSLSDPRYSYQLLKWFEVTAGKKWQNVIGTLQWYNVVNNSDLFA
jgi:hypothetical protein